MADAAAPAKKAAKAKKPPKPKVPAAHPPYAAMIASAIAALKERSGSSRQAILKYIQANYKVGSDTLVVSRLRIALKKSVASGKVKQVKGTGASGSFKLGEKAKAEKKPKAKKPAAKKVKKPKKAAAAKPKKPAAAKKAKSPKKAKKPAAKKPAAKPKKSAKTAKPKAAKKPAAKKPAAKKAAWFNILLTKSLPEKPFSGLPKVLERLHLNSRSTH